MYDEERGVHYMFGGNPGGKEMTSAAGRARLGDFWRLELQRPRPAELQRKLVLAVRRARYQELAPDPLQAVRYLQVQHPARLVASATGQKFRLGFNSFTV